MKLSKLKEETFGWWEIQHLYHDAIAQPENFKPEVRKLGDLRRKETWIRAYCQFVANGVLLTGDGRTIVGFVLQFDSDNWRYEIRDRVLDACLQIPQVARVIGDGIREIIQQPFDYGELKAAHELLELAREKSRKGSGGAVELVAARLSTSKKKGKLIGFPFLVVCMSCLWHCC